MASREREEALRPEPAADGESKAQSPNPFANPSSQVYDILLASAPAPASSESTLAPTLGSAPYASEHLAVDTVTFGDGTSYTGTLKNGIPDGIGRCVWQDGNTYDGEWRAGLMHGFGTYLWTSGQRYDGEWKDGKREGIGVKLYADGSSFDGFWRDGQKHGVGVFRPAKRKLSTAVSATVPPPPRRPPLDQLATSPSDSPQRSAQRSGGGGGGSLGGSQRSGAGSQRGGVHPTTQGGGGSVLGPRSMGVTPLGGGGRGSLVGCQTLPRRLGDIDENIDRILKAEKGRTASDAGVQVAHADSQETHQQAPSHQHHHSSSAGGVPRPPRGVPPAEPDDSRHMPHRVTADTAEAGTAGRSTLEPAASGNGDDELLRDDQSAVSSNFPQGSDGPRKQQLLIIRAFENGRLLREDAIQASDVKRIFSPLWASTGTKVRKRVKEALGIGRKLKEKHGQLLYKGMPGYNLMAQLQLGVRYSIGKMNQRRAEATDGPLNLRAHDFTEKQKVFFPADGSSTTPAHPCADFKWKDYAPRVFHSLRAMYGISEPEYMLALGGSQSLYQLSSPGKSGCLFFLSEDERFLIKTMRKSEIRTLLGMLPGLHSHVAESPKCLISRFYGVHGVKRVHGRIVRFVVMQNLFNSDVQIHRKFDLKGSTFERSANVKDTSNAKVVFKDLDLDFHLRPQDAQYAATMAQVRRDAGFLSSEGVMDYSLLLGIHYLARNKDGNKDGGGGKEGGDKDGGGKEGGGKEGGGKQDGGKDVGSDVNDGRRDGNGAAAVDRSTTETTRPSLPPIGPPHSFTSLEVMDSVMNPLPEVGARFSPPFVPSTVSTVDGGTVPAGERDSDDQQQQQLQQQPQLSSSLNRGFGSSFYAVSSSLGRGDSSVAGFVAAPQPPSPLRGGGGGGGEEGLPPTPQPSRDAGANATTPGSVDSRLGKRTSQPGDVSGGGAHDTPAMAAERLRNFDLFVSNPEDCARRLTLIEQRMREEGFSDQRVSDLLSLAKLQVLGDKFTQAKLKKRGRAPALVMQMLNQNKPLTADTDSNVGSVEGEEFDGRPSSLAQRDTEQQQLGINMHALAVSKSHPAETEEVVITFGIIDILQEYNFRKLVERGFKSLMHDAAAISVAPPDKYAQRFITFMQQETFQEPTKAGHWPPQTIPE